MLILQQSKTSGKSFNFCETEHPKRGVYGETIKL